jgi:retinol dehydrogenase 14
MIGQVCLVTGANSGLGRATALELAKGGATVVMVCRDKAKGEAARADIIETTGNTDVELLIADLSSQRAIYQLVKTFKAKHDKLHVLINNAGLNLRKRTLSEDGIEMTFAVNHFAPFLLTHLLLESLEAAASAKIINVTSDMQRPIRFDDLKREQAYNQIKVYEESKLANVLFTYELAQRLRGSGVTVNCVAPGFIRTNLGRDSKGGFKLFLQLVRPFMQSPKQAAKALVYLATSPDLAGVSGKYFTGKKEAESSKASYDKVAAGRLWQLSEEMTGQARAVRG